LSKKLFFIMLIIIGFLFSCKHTNFDKNIKLPNVVFIVIDTLRADHLPFYGYSKNTAPFLTSIAKKGIVFERAFSASSWTAPATASIFTSMYPFQHRVVSNMLATLKFNEGLEEQYKIKLNKIPKEITTLAEIFKERGYATYGFADNVNIGKKEGFEQGFDKLETHNYKTAFYLTKTVKTWKKELEKRDKYFLYLHFMDPHTPLHRRKRWFEIINENNNGSRQSKDERKEKISQYDSEINLVDRKIKELFEYFKWDKNTLVIVTADHGEELWDHGAFGHGYSLYKEVIHVPLLFYYPEGDFKKQRLKDIVSTIDILPTLRKFIGLSRDNLNEGKSLLDMIQRNEKLSDRMIFSHLLKRKVAGKTTDKDFVAVSVIYEKWHYIRALPNLEGKYEQFFFDIKHDFSEKSNLYNDNNLMKIIKRMKNEFFKFRKTCKKFKPNTGTYRSNKNEMERLTTLGYIE